MIPFDPNLRPILRATVITDASFDPETGAAGWAAWIRHNNDGGVPVTQSGKIRGRCQNSTEAEIKAAINGVFIAARCGATHVLLQSDCMSVIHLAKGTAKSPWMLDLWNEAMYSAPFAGLVIRGKHVKGHGPINSARAYVNDWCDKYSRQHMRRGRKDAKQYSGK